MTGGPGDTSRSEWPVCDDAIREAFASLISDGSWGRYHGPYCDRLRADLADFFGVRCVHLCCSGTSAMELALRAAGTGTGDEVVLCAYDFKANFQNVLTVGAVPVLVDCEPGVPVMQVSQLEQALTARTRAIIVSHLHGALTEMSLIMLIAASRGLVVIEDACQCPGAEVRGSRAGTQGHIGILSFGGSKLLTAGRGGALLTNDLGMAQRLRLFTQRGNDAYPLSEMQAAVLVPQLHRLRERNLARHRQALELLAALSELQCGMSQQLVAAVIPPVDSTQVAPAFYKLALRLRTGAVSADGGASHSASREQVVVRAHQRQLCLDAGFPALHRIHGRSRFRTSGGLENASELHESLLVLHHTELLTSRRSPAECAQLLIDCLASQPSGAD